MQPWQDPDYQPPQQLVQQRRSLSVGDALVVIALLLFILGWVVGGLYVLGQGVEEGEELKLSVWDQIFWFAVIGFPAMWAGDMIRKVITGRTKDEDEQSRRTERHPRP